jgi:hypothetical protein
MRQFGMMPQNAAVAQLVERKLPKLVGAPTEAKQTPLSCLGRAVSGLQVGLGSSRIASVRHEDLRDLFGVSA